MRRFERCGRRDGFDASIPHLRIEMWGTHTSSRKKQILRCAQDDNLLVKVTTYQSCLIQQALRFLDR